MKPTLPIQQFQVLGNSLYVLDSNGTVWGTNDWADGENWINYCEKLAYKPVLGRRPPPSVTPTPVPASGRRGKDGK